MWQSLSEACWRLGNVCTQYSSDYSSESELYGWELSNFMARQASWLSLYFKELWFFDMATEADYDFWLKTIVS